MAYDALPEGYQRAMQSDCSAGHKIQGAFPLFYL